MPIYNYKCTACGHDFEIRHGMFFIQENCVSCGRRGYLEKAVTKILEKVKSDSFQNKVGDKVKEHIEVSKKEIEEEKKELRKRNL